MTRRVPPLVIIGIILLCGYALQAQTTDTVYVTVHDTVHDTVFMDSSVAVKVLEERVASVKEGLAREAEERRENKSDTRVEMVIYATMFGLFIAVVGWLGKHYIERLTRDRVDETVAPELKRKWKEMATQIDKTSRELEALYRDKFEREYEKVSALAEEYKDANAKIPEEVAAQLAEFRETLSRVKTHDEYTAEDWFNKGVRQRQSDHPEQAIESLSKAIEMDSTSHWPYYSRGLVYCQLGRYGEAIQSYRTAVKMRPEAGYLRTDLAEALLMSGQTESALEEVDRALSLLKETKDKAAALYLKWTCEILRGDVSDSTSVDLERILKEDFDLTWSFDEIEQWLPTADIPPIKRQQIIEMTNKLKAKRKKKDDSDDDSAAAAVKK